MKKTFFGSLLVAAISCATPTFLQAATGYFGNLYTIIDAGSGNQFFQIRTGTTPGTGAASGHNLANDGVNPQFSNFGSFASGGTFTLRGFEYRTFNDNGSNVTFANLFYRIYPSGSPTGTYSQIQYNTPTSNVGNDKTWAGTGASTNLLSGLSNGNYTLEVYTESFTNGVNTAGNIFGFTSANQPTATFTVVPEPSTLAVVGLSGLAVVALMRRRKA